jgi:hypothetical protein
MAIPLGWRQLRLVEIGSDQCMQVDKAAGADRLLPFLYGNCRFAAQFGARRPHITGCHDLAR